MEYNVQQEARVWNRVLASEGAAAAPAGLSELIRGELAAACTYDALAARVCGCARETLRSIAREERCHAKTLGAIHFLLTGHKSCPEPPHPPCITCTAEALRERYRAELAAAQAYEARAAEGGEQSAVFSCLAAEERRHAEKLVCVIGQTL